MRHQDPYAEAPPWPRWARRAAALTVWLWLPFVAVAILAACMVGVAGKMLTMLWQSNERT